jgi:hypothetical protein
MACEICGLASAVELLGLKPTTLTSDEGHEDKEAREASGQKERIMG